MDAEDPEIQVQPLSKTLIPEFPTRSLHDAPPSVLKKVGVGSLRVYTSLENILTWDHLGDLPIDPEAVVTNVLSPASNYNSGRIGTGIPTFKSVSFGVQLNF